mmetsp:Transcript_102145/g.284431  ORF Transcript_102145/g.284431 Transcript_102145/m.284431 type:complete len:248 (+) Transcript_102145:1510-2253(+)
MRPQTFSFMTSTRSRSCTRSPTQTASLGTQRWRTCWRIAGATCSASRRGPSRLTCRSCRASWWVSRAPRSSASITFQCRRLMCHRVHHCTDTLKRRTSRQPTRSRALASPMPTGACWRWMRCRACASTSPASPSSAFGTCATLTCSTGLRSSMATGQASLTRRSSSSQRRCWPSRASTARRPNSTAEQSSITWLWRCTQSCGSGMRPNIGPSRARRLVPAPGPLPTQAATPKSMRTSSPRMTPLHRA